MLWLRFSIAGSQVLPYICFLFEKPFHISQMFNTANTLGNYLVMIKCHCVALYVANVANNWLSYCIIKVTYCAETWDLNTLSSFITDWKLIIMLVAFCGSVLNLLGGRISEMFWTSASEIDGPDLSVQWVPVFMFHLI